MKYIDEFRDGKTAQAIAEVINLKTKNTGKQYRFMEFCGGHTHAIYRYGLQDLLPNTIEMIHGPGCPVCVLPMGRIDNAIDIASNKNVMLCTYADMMRVPSSKKDTLLKARARGCDVRMVYSVLDALTFAQENPQKEVVFLAIGFETTTPPTASALQRAIDKSLPNFKVFCNHVLTPPALKQLLIAESSSTDKKISGFIGPAHVSTIIGSKAYEACALEYHKPFTIAGFEPLDIIQAILMLVEQVNANEYKVENEYTRSVTEEGNVGALNLMSKFFSVRDSFEWRGLGEIPFSALKLKEEYAKYDAENFFEIKHYPAAENSACQCGEILQGKKKPSDCPLFGKVCSPENPMGSCMVSSEGSCAAYYAYGRFRG